jgi:hypothetical protein
MSDPNDALKPISDIINAEPVKNLLSPLTKEVGELIGTVANCARFYATENLEKIFTKWANAHRSGYTIEPEAFKKIMPLLPLASMVGDDELQDKWALLMESTATEGGSLPSFGQTLFQLTAEEVQYLDRLWKLVLTPTGYTSEHRFGREPLSYSQLMQVFDPDINTEVNPAERKIFEFTEEQKANYERLGYAQLVIEDLIRLGILVDRKTPFEQSQAVLRSQYSFSQYGVAFMQAVTQKDAVR